MTSSLHPFTSSEMGVMVSSRRLCEVVLRGHSVSNVIAHGTAASNTQAGTGVGKTAGTDQSLASLFCVRAARAFPISKQNQTFHEVERSQMKDFMK